MGNGEKMNGYWLSEEAQEAGEIFFLEQENVRDRQEPDPVPLPGRLR